MDYEEFRAEWDKALDAAGSFSLDDAAMAAEVERLKSLATSFTDPFERKGADRMIATLEDVLSYEREPMSEEMAEAHRVLARVDKAGGTPAERIARAEAAMEEIGRLSENAAPDEQGPILELNESLDMLIGSLRQTDTDDD